MKPVLFFARIVQPFVSFWRCLSQCGKLEPKKRSRDLLQLQAGKEVDLASWNPTHRHRKGGFYRILGDGILEADGRFMTIYDDAEGTTWIRSTAEFDDGRFEPCQSKGDSCP